MSETKDPKKPGQPPSPGKTELYPVLIHDRSLSRKIAKDSTADHILTEEVLVLGGQLVTQLQILFKTVRIHDRTNTALNPVVEALLTTIQTLAHDGPVTLRLQQDFLYLGDQHLKMGVQQTMIFLEFIDMLDSSGIEALTFRGDLQARDLREFAYLFIAFEPGSPIVPELRRQMSANGISGIEVKESTSLKILLNPKNMTPKALGKKLYLKAVGVVGEVLQSVKERRAPNFRQAKRVVQNLVDLILREEPILLGLTTLRCYDQYTHNHSVNVALLSLALANRAGYPKTALVDLGLAALFHDMGKVSLPLELLNKPEELSEKDWEHMRTHPARGVIQLIRLRGLKNLSHRMAAAAFEHHMYLDQSGYPPTNEPWELSLTGRILAISDCYDGLTSSRVYRRTPVAPEKVLQMMLSKSGQAFDPVLLKLFIHSVGIYPIGSLVLLDTDELAVVVRPSPDLQRGSRPWVKVISDPKGNPLEEGPELDLTEMNANGQYSRSIVRLVDNTEYRFDTSQYFL
jgi:HD-GYP domain-containing protein (c-di-GMP phosphodiesterase class II)